MRFVNMSVRQALKCDADRGRAFITEGYQESGRKLLNKSDIRVEIETNGAVDIAPLANAFSKENLALLWITSCHPAAVRRKCFSPIWKF